jgi:hypothetical protein
MSTWGTNQTVYSQNMNQNPYIFNPILNEIHTYFPALLYDTNRFHTLQSVFQYVQAQISDRYDVFSSWQRHYQTNYQTNNRSVPNAIHTPSRNRRRRRNRNRNRINVNNNANNNLSTTYHPTNNFSNSNQTLNTSLINLLAQAMLPSLEPVYTVMIPTNTTRFSDPVIVAPTAEQINNGSALQTSLGIADISCAVCQQNVTSGEIIRRLLPCNHQYHKDCIDTWFQRNVHCPVCRHDIRDQ